MLNRSQTLLNIDPHIGSAYPTMAADAFARFQRLIGNKVRFITGSDEHGEKIAASAQKSNLQPIEQCDKYVKRFEELWKLLDIKYDKFIRTTTEPHQKLVNQMILRAQNSGDIYKGSYEGYYCVDCEEYKTKPDMTENNDCLVHQRPCELRSESNYFFKLSNYQKLLENLIIDNKSFVQPYKIRPEVQRWVQDGVRDFSISRTKVDWGFQLPMDNSQTIYVWYDALTGYLTGLFDQNDNVDLDIVSQKGWPSNVHIIGKDIMRFHTLFWPAMCKSSGLSVPQQVFVHGLLTKNNLKMGKSMGNTLDTFALTDYYGSDSIRYYFLSAFTFGSDGDFTESIFRDYVNSHLANNLGNLYSRCANLLKKYYNLSLPVSSSSIPESSRVRQVLKYNMKGILESYQQFKFDLAISKIMEIAGECNAQFERNETWNLLKKGTDEQKQIGAQDLVTVLEAIRIIAIMLAPITTNLSPTIHQLLGFRDQDYQNLQWSDTDWGVLEEGHTISQPQPIFPRKEGSYVTESSSELNTNNQHTNKNNNKNNNKKQNKAKQKAMAQSSQQ